MYCPQCGAPNDDGNWQCDRCGRALPRAVDKPPLKSVSERPRIPNHLVKAVLATLFCCLPLGIVAIVFAAQVNGKIEAGDFAGAKEMSSKADTWGNASIILGVLGTIASFFLMLATGDI